MLHYTTLYNTIQLFTILYYILLPDADHGEQQDQGHAHRGPHQPLVVSHKPHLFVPAEIDRNLWLRRRKNYEDKHNFIQSISIVTH